MQNLYMQPNHQSNHKSSQYGAKAQQNLSNTSTNGSSISSSNGGNQYVAMESKRFSTDYLSSMNKFQYVLMAPTSPAVKVNEDTLTYLNQGQNYELKLTRLPSPKSLATMVKTSA